MALFSSSFEPLCCLLGVWRHASAAFILSSETLHRPSMAIFGVFLHHFEVFFGRLRQFLPAVCTRKALVHLFARPLHRVAVGGGVGVLSASAHLLDGFELMALQILDAICARQFSAADRSRSLCPSISKERHHVQTDWTNLIVVTEETGQIIYLRRCDCFLRHIPTNNANTWVNSNRHRCYYCSTTQPGNGKVPVIVVTGRPLPPATGYYARSTRNSYVIKITGPQSKSSKKGKRKMRHFAAEKGKDPRAIDDGDGPISAGRASTYAVLGVSRHTTRAITS